MLVLAITLLGSAELFALTTEKVKLLTWRGGETIFGVEFIAANEAVADYIAALPHPTERLRAIRFECDAKVRTVGISVRSTQSPSVLSYGDIPTIYEISGCKVQ